MGNQTATFMGMYSKFRIMIQNSDVSSSVVSLQIFQDIQSPTWSLQIQMLDSSDLLTTIPIIAGTPIQITIGTKNGQPTDDERTFTFNVYRIANKKLQNQKVQTYTIFAAPYAFFQNQVTKITQTYSNQSPVDMINTIVNDVFDGYTLKSTPCDNQATIMATGWTPTDAIGFMLKVAHKSGGADFMFFQSDDKEFTCNSIETLLNDSENETGETLIFRPANLNQQNFDTMYNFAILKYEWQHFDTMLDLSAGVVKSKMLSLDFLSKVYSEKKYSYGDDIASDGNGSTLFADPIFNKADDAHVCFVAKHTGMNGDIDSVMNSADSWLQSRRASLQKIDQEKLLVQLPGSTGMCDWIGQTVNVSLPSQVDEKSESMDPNRSGTFLVTAITHWCKSDSYVVNLELVKRRLNNQ